MFIGNKEPRVSEKQRALNFMYSNWTSSNDPLSLKFRKRFELFAVTETEHKKEKVAFSIKSDLCPVWLPGPDSNQRQGG